MDEKFSKTAFKDEIVKRNLDFIYGKAKDEHLHDADKRIYIKSLPKFETNKIKDFSGEYDFLSPSYPCSVYLPDDVENESYPSFEHALHASKFDTTDLRRKHIRKINDIREVKRTIKIATTESWKEKCLSIGECILRDKFFRNKGIKVKLMKSIDNTLEYHNKLGDTFWGLCDEKGTNYLGKLLEKIRHDIDEGRDMDIWIQYYFQLKSHVKVYIKVNVYKDNQVIVEKSKVYAKRNRISFGTLEQSDFQLFHPSASRLHAILLVDEKKGAILIDMNSANKTYINDIEAVPFQSYNITNTMKIRFGADSNHHYLLDVDDHYDETIQKQIVHKIITTDDEKNTNNKNNRDKSVYENIGTGSGTSKEMIYNEYTIVVTNITTTANEKEVLAFFTKYGNVTSIHYPMDKYNPSQSKGIAFITYENSRGYLQGLSCDQDMFLNQKLKVRKYIPKDKSDNGHKSKDNNRDRDRDFSIRQQHDRNTDRHDSRDRNREYGSRRKREVSHDRDVHVHDLKRSRYDEKVLKDNSDRIRDRHRDSSRDRQNNGRSRYNTDSRDSRDNKTSRYSRHEDDSSNRRHRSRSRSPLRRHEDDRKRRQSSETRDSGRRTDKVRNRADSDTDSDVSPPRRSQPPPRSHKGPDSDSDSDVSPPRRSQSPPRSHKGPDSDVFSPRRSQPPPRSHKGPDSDSDVSPPRRSQSPLRSHKGPDSDVFSPRRSQPPPRSHKGPDSDSDVSPPRRSQPPPRSHKGPDSESDASPPRRSQQSKQSVPKTDNDSDSDSDISVPRRSQQPLRNHQIADSDSDLSPPRRRN